MASQNGSPPAPYIFPCIMHVILTSLLPRAIPRAFGIADLPGFTARDPQDIVIGDPMHHDRRRPIYSGLAYHPRSPRFRTIVRMKRRDARQKEIAGAIGVSRARVQQLIERIEQVHGGRILAPTEPRYTLCAAARLLGFKYGDTVLNLCADANLTPARRGRRQYAFTREDIEKLRWANKARKRKTCAACGKPFRVRTARRGPLKDCCPRCRDRTYAERLRTPFVPQKARSEWHRELWERLHSASRRLDTRWLTHGQAMARSGLSSMRVTYLRLRGIVATRPHPNRTWHGRPMQLFAAREVTLAGKIFASWRRRTTPSSSLSRSRR